MAITSAHKAHMSPFAGRQTIKTVTPRMTAVLYLTLRVQTIRRSLQRLFTTHRSPRTTLTPPRLIRLRHIHLNRPPRPPLQRPATQLLPHRRSPTQRLCSLGMKMAVQHLCHSLYNPLGLLTMPDRGYRVKVDKAGRISPMCHRTLRTRRFDVLSTSTLSSSTEWNGCEEAKAERKLPVSFGVPLGMTGEWNRNSCTNCIISPRAL